MVEGTVISASKLEELLKTKKRSRAGKWKEMCEHVKKTREIRLVEGLSKGQIAGINRTAKKVGVQTECWWSEGKIVISPVT